MNLLGTDTWHNFIERIKDIFYPEYISNHNFDLNNPTIENRGYKMGEDGRERPINRTHFKCKNCSHVLSFSRKRMDSLTEEEKYGCKRRVFFLKYLTSKILNIK